MPWNNPTIAEFKDEFDRDFPYNDDPELGFRDKDINRAFEDCNVTINGDLFGDQAGYKKAYLNLAAHFLQTNYEQSSQGVSGQFNFSQTGKSVGSVSESFGVPQSIADDPQWAAFCKTKYGARYVLMVYGRSKGIVLTVRGRTKP